MKIVVFDAYEAYLSGVEGHPVRIVQGLGCKTFRYEYFGSSDMAAIEVDKLPEPMPCFLSEAKPKFMFS